MWRTIRGFAASSGNEKSVEIGLEMSPGFQMLTRWGQMQIARRARMGLQLVRFRSWERENERQLIEHTSKHHPGGAMLILRTLAVEINLWNSQMVCGGPSVDSLLPRGNEKSVEIGLEMSPGSQK